MNFKFRPRVELLETRAVPTTDNWTGLAGDGKWGTNNNWDEFHPPWDDEVVVLAAGGGTIRVDVNTAKPSAISISAAAAYTFELAADMHLASGGMTNTTSGLFSTVVFSIGSGSLKVDGGGTFTVDCYGAAFEDGGGGNYGSGGTISVDTGSGLQVKNWKGSPSPDSGATVTFDKKITVNGNFQVIDRTVNLANGLDLRTSSVAPNGQILLQGNAVVTGSGTIDIQNGDIKVSPTNWHGNNAVVDVQLKTVMTKPSGTRYPGFSVESAANEVNFSYSGTGNGFEMSYGTFNQMYDTTVSFADDVSIDHSAVTFNSGSTQNDSVSMNFNVAASHAATFDSDSISFWGSNDSGYTAGITVNTSGEIYILASTTTYMYSTPSSFYDKWNATKFRLDNSGGNNPDLYYYLKYDAGVGQVTKFFEATDQIIGDIDLYAPVSTGKVYVAVKQNSDKEYWLIRTS